MANNKLAIIGGSGLYDIDEFKEREFLKLETPWGKPSDEILKTKYNDKEIFFLPRHGKGHAIPPSNINFRANIDALKQLGVTDLVSVSAVGSLKEDLPPGKFVIVDQFIDRTFARTNFPGGKSSLREPTAETDTISVTPSCLSASIFALKFILDGEIKWPLPCLGKK